MRSCNTENLMLPAAFSFFSWTSELRTHFSYSFFFFLLPRLVKKQVFVSSRTCVRSPCRAIRKGATLDGARVCDRWIRVAASNALEITTDLIGSIKPVLLHWANIKKPEVRACIKNIREKFFVILFYLSTDWSVSVFISSGDYLLPSGSKE